MKNKFIGKLLEQRAILDAGIEIVGGEYGVTTISEELQTRLNTRRKINRSLSNILKGDNHTDVFEMLLEDIQKLQAENDHYIRKLIALKKDLSPFKDVQPKQSDKFEVGAILVDQWGWEQTNVDFYCVVKVSGQYVTVLPMTKITGPEVGFMTNEEEPGDINFTGDPQRKKVQNNSEGQPHGFSFRDYAGGGYCRLWDGKKQTSTHYA